MFYIIMLITENFHQLTFVFYIIVKVKLFEYANLLADLNFYPLKAL
jgi:hypothetical protein